MSKGLFFSRGKICISILLIFCLGFTAFTPEVIKAYAINSEDLSVEGLVGTDWSVSETEKKIAARYTATTTDGNSDTDRLYMDSSYFADNCILGGDTLGVFNEKYKGFCPMTVETESDVEDASEDLYGFSGLDLSKAGIVSLDNIPLTNLSVNVADLNEPDNWWSNFWAFCGSALMGLGAAGIAGNLGVRARYEKSEKWNNYLKQQDEIKLERDASVKLQTEVAQASKAEFTKTLADDIRKQWDQITYKNGELMFPENAYDNTKSIWNTSEYNKAYAQQDSPFARWNNKRAQLKEMTEKYNSLKNDNEQMSGFDNWCKETKIQYQQKLNGDRDCMFDFVENKAKDCFLARQQSEKNWENFKAKPYFENGTKFKESFDGCQPTVIKELNELEDKIKVETNPTKKQEYIKQKKDLEDSASAAIDGWCDEYGFTRESFAQFRRDYNKYFDDYNNCKKGLVAEFRVEDTVFVIEVGEIKSTNVNLEYDIPIKIRTQAISQEKENDVNCHYLNLKINSEKGNLDYSDAKTSNNLRNEICDKICNFMYTNSKLKELEAEAVKKHTEIVDFIKSEYENDPNRCKQKIEELDKEFVVINSELDQMRKDVDATCLELASNRVKALSELVKKISENKKGKSKDMEFSDNNGNSDNNGKRINEGGFEDDNGNSDNNGNPIYEGGFDDPGWNKKILDREDPEEEIYTNNEKNGHQKTWFDEPDGYDAEGNEMYYRGAESSKNGESSTNGGSSTNAGSSTNGGSSTNAGSSTNGGSSKKNAAGGEMDDPLSSMKYYDAAEKKDFEKLRNKLEIIEDKIKEDNENYNKRIQKLKEDEESSYAKEGFGLINNIITYAGWGADILGSVCYAFSLASRKDNEPLKTNVKIKGTGDGCLALKIGKGVEESTTNGLAVEIEYRNQETGERKVVVEDGLRTPLDYDEYLKYLDDISTQIPEDEYGWHKIKELGGGFIPTAMFIRTSGKTCDVMADEINEEYVKTHINTACSTIEQWNRGDVYNSINGWIAAPEKDILENLDQTVALYDKLSTNSKKKVKVDCEQQINKIKSFVPRYIDLTSERTSIYEIMIGEIEVLKNDMYFLKSGSIYTIEDLYRIVNSVFELNTVVTTDESVKNFRESISEIYDKFKVASLDIISGVPRNAERFTSLFKFTTELLWESHNLDEQLDFINKIQYMYDDYIIEVNNMNTIEGYVCNTPYYNDINKNEIFEVYQDFCYALDNFISIVYSDSYAKLSLLNCSEEEHASLCEKIESLWNIKFDTFTLINTIRDLDFHFQNL